MRNRLREAVRLICATALLFYRRIPYYAIASLSLYILVVIGIHGYYRFMPASWFIHVRSTPTISNGQVDSTLTLTFCRDTRYPNINAVGARSYYVILNQKQSPAGSYTFTAKIEHNQQCQYIQLDPSKHPGTAGTYLAHTDLTFYVEGHRKVLSYDTETFQLSDTRKSLQDQINDLQQKINDLKGRQDAVAPAQTRPSSSVASTAIPGPTAAQTPQTAAPAIQPSQPTTPTTASPQPQPSAIQQLLSAPGNLVEGLIKWLR